MSDKIGAGQRAVVYARAPQFNEHDRTPVEVQLDACLALAIHLGYTVEPQAVLQEDTPNSSLVRPGMTTLIGLVAQQQGTAVITHTLDRLGRLESEGLEALLRELRRRAVPIYVAKIPKGAQRLFQWQLAVLYITSCWNKWHGSYWQDGTATYYSLRLTEFEKFPVPEFAKHMPWLAVTTWGTLIIQMAMGTLVFARPFRNYALIGGLILHFSLEYVVNVPIFQWIITSLYVSHIDGEEWVRWWNKWSTKRFGAQAVPEVAE